MTNEPLDGEFEELLKRATALRGHLCLGLPLGIKMSRKGLRLMGMVDPKERDGLVVFVENNRCAVDAVQVTTGCSMGSRRLKVFEYGKSAATFRDRESERAIRVFARPELNSEAVRLAVAEGVISGDDRPEPTSQAGRRALMNAFMKMGEDQIFDSRSVRIRDVAKYARGTAVPRANCFKCGEEIIDGRGILRAGRTLCVACDGSAYYIE